MFSGPATEIFNNYCITSNICSNANNRSEPKILFSYNAGYMNELKVFSLREGRFSECCSMRSDYLSNITMWIPDTDGNYIDLVAAAHSNIKFFRLDQNIFVPMAELLESDYCNPIISSEWNPCNLEQIAAIRNDGTCFVLNYDIASRERNVTYTYNFSGCSNICFGRGAMRNNLFQIYRSGVVLYVDLRSNLLKNLFPFFENKVISMKYSINNDHMIAFLTAQTVEVIDVRMNRKINRLNFINDIGEYKCFCWSPNSDKIFLGTSTGSIIQWPLDDYKILYDSYISTVSTVNKIHCSSLIPDVLLFSGRSESGESVKFLN